MIKFNKLDRNTHTVNCRIDDKTDRIGIYLLKASYLQTAIDECFQGTSGKKILNESI